MQLAMLYEFRQTATNRSYSHYNCVLSFYVLTNEYDRMWKK